MKTISKLKENMTTVIVLCVLTIICGLAYSAHRNAGGWRTKDQAEVNISKIEGVQKVFMHQAGEYSIACFAEGKELKVLAVNDAAYHSFKNPSVGNIGSRVTTRIVADAEPGKMYLEIQEWDSNPLLHFYVFDCILHIDSPDTIEGSEYEPDTHSKGPRKKAVTEVIR